MPRRPHEGDQVLTLIVALVIVGFALYIVGLLPIDGTIKQIIRAVVILMVCLWVLEALGAINLGLRFR